MATWQEIGIENYRAARECYDHKCYRSRVSRFSYAAFSVLTDVLAAKGVDFGDQQETPNHKGLPKLIELNLRLQNQTECIAIIRRLYSARITPDYQRRTIDEAVAYAVRRDAATLFRHLGVENDQRRAACD